MKGFVHEVLHRSRMSGSILQTALCYLEAIRAKVLELVTQEKEHPGSTYQKESVDSANFDGSTSSSDTPAGNGLLDTIRVNSISFEIDSSFLEW